MNGGIKLNNNIYFPNIYRKDNYRSSNDINIKIPYYQQFSIEDDNEIQLLMYVRTRKLIEQLLLYDKVYVDLSELPAVISCLSDIDESATSEIIKSHISYVNSYDFSFGCIQNEGRYFSHLGCGVGKTDLIYDENKMKEHLYKNFKYRPHLDSELKTIIENSIKYDKDYSKELVHAIAKDIEDKFIKEKLKIDSPSATCILKKDIPYINAFCEANRGLYIATEIGICNVYLDDIIRDIICTKVDKIQAVIKAVDFNKLLKMYEVPDIELMLLYGYLTLEDILLIKESSDFKTFQKWFFSPEANDKDIVKAYINTIKKRTKEPIIVKSIMLFLSTVLGLINPILGLGVSSIDAFILDKIKYSKDIEESFENIIEKLTSEVNEHNKIPNIVTEEYRKFYTVV